MHLRARFRDLEGGMWLEEALEAFVDGCNVPYQTLWLTESWAAPLFAPLRARVRGPVSDDLAVALRQVACKEHRLEDLVAWVEQPEPRAGWAEFAKRCNDAREVAEAVAMRDFLAGQGVNGAPEIGWRLPGWWSFEASRAVDSFEPLPDNDAQLVVGNSVSKDAVIDPLTQGLDHRFS